MLTALCDGDVPSETFLDTVIALLLNSNRQVQGPTEKPDGRCLYLYKSSGFPGGLYTSSFALDKNCTVLELLNLRGYEENGRKETQHAANLR
jgi:hypothetical protein